MVSVSVALKDLQYDIPLKVEKTLNSEITRLALKYGQSEKLARAIMKCESHLDQSARGYQAVKGVDIGLWQINNYYNQSDAEKKGFDIYSWEGNLEYGFELLSEQGTQPWNSSRPCWINEL